MLRVFQMKLDRIAGIDTDAIFLRVMLMQEMKDLIVKLNQGQMYDLGIDSKGNSLGDYTPFSAMMKDKAGQRNDHITLLDKGIFYGSMEVVEKDGDGVVVAADMQKPDQNLEDRWPDALGLTQESIEAIRPLFKQLFIVEWRKEVNMILYGKKAA